MSFDAVTLQHRLTFGAEHLCDVRGTVASADELYVCDEAAGRVHVFGASSGEPHRTLGARLQVASPSGYEAHWGLTALLPAELTKRSKQHTPLLLALWRGYAETDSWWNRLSLLPRIPLEAKAGAPLSPLMSWNLKRIGLEPDNWEAMEGGPPLEDGRPTLLMASDNNFNPLRQNRLALLAPRRSGRCESWPP